MLGSVNVTVGAVIYPEPGSNELIDVIILLFTIGLALVLTPAVIREPADTEPAVTK